MGQKVLFADNGNVYGSLLFFTILRFGGCIASISSCFQVLAFFLEEETEQSAST
jgi:hypothetical protein